MTITVGIMVIFFKYHFEFLKLQRQLLPEKKPSSLTSTKMTSGKCLPATFAILEPRVDTRHSVILRLNITKMILSPTLASSVGSRPHQETL